MKKKHLFFTAVLTSGFVFSQVGVNTANPQGVFNIDAAKDNPTTGVPNTAQQANDIAVTAIGNMGLGTVAPTNKLHLNNATPGAIRIVDGTQGVGKVLTSDENGVGRWDLAPITYTSNASQSPFTITTPNTWRQSALNVTVPETGVYYINFNARAWFNGTYSDGAWWKAELRSSVGAALVGTVFGAHASSGGNNADVTSSYSTVKLLNKGEVLSLWFYGTSNFTGIGDTNGASSITIFRLGS